MDKQTLVQIYNALNEVEVKGFDNINRLFGVLFTIRKELEQPQEQEDKME